MTRRLPLLILCAANLLFAISVATTHGASPTIALWAKYMPFELLIGAFVYSGVTGLVWFKTQQPSERRLVFYFIGSMAGFSCYLVLSFSYALVSGNWNAIVLVATLYAFAAWIFAEGYLA